MKQQNSVTTQHIASVGEIFADAPFSLEAYVTTLELFAYSANVQKQDTVHRLTEAFDKIAQLGFEGTKQFSEDMQGIKILELQDFLALMFREVYQGKTFGFIESKRLEMFQILLTPYMKFEDVARTVEAMLQGRI